MSCLDYGAFSASASFGRDNRLRCAASVRLWSSFGEPGRQIPRSQTARFGTAGGCGYSASYELVKRFVRTIAPTRRGVGVLHCAPGADYGQFPVMVSPEEARRRSAVSFRTTSA